MKIFDILKNASGKLVMGVPQLAAIAGVGALAVYGAYETDATYASKEAPIRTLSGISSSSSYEGLQNKGGLLTSINVKDSLNQVASEEERAAFDAKNGPSNNFAAASETRIDNWNPGAAAETSVTEGLGMGGNEAVFNGPAAGARAAGKVPAVDGAAVAAAASAGTQTPVLGTASMARASGNAFQAASGALASSGGTRGGTSGSGASASSSGEGYNFTGAMPSGSNAISALNGGRAFGSGNSTFMAGGRHSTTSSGRRSFREKNDLRDIAKRSADAASNSSRSSNEGSRAFLASTRNSGGMRVEGGVTTGSGGSADLSAPRNQNLKAIGEWAEKEDDFAERQDKARKRLMWMVLALVAAAVVAMPIAYNLISKGKQAGLFGLSMVVWGWAILGAVMAYAATVIGFGIDYHTKYNGQMMPIMSYILGAGAIGAMIFTGLAATRNQGKAAAKDKFMGIVKKASKAVGGTLVQEGASMAKEKISEGLNK